MHDIADLNEEVDIAEEDDIERYLSMSVENIKVEKLLLWWKSKEIELPSLSRVTKKILSIPATSCPSERDFSCAGYTYNERRTNLKPETLDALL